MLNKLNYLLIKPEFILTNRNHSRHHFLQLFTHCQTQSRFNRTANHELRNIHAGIGRVSGCTNTSPRQRHKTCLFFVCILFVKMKTEIQYLIPLREQRKKTRHIF